MLLFMMHSPDPPDLGNNEFLVRDGLAEEEALALVQEYEGRGHRQAYWVKHESGSR